MLNKLNTALAAATIGLSALGNVQAETNKGIEKCLEEPMKIVDAMASSNGTFSFAYNDCKSVYSYATFEYGSVAGILSPEAIKIYEKEGIEALWEYLIEINNK